MRDVPQAGRAPCRVLVPGLSGRPGDRQGHGRLSARGGANEGRWETAGLYTGLRAASSGTGLTGAPRRPALRALQSALVGVQPTMLQGPRPSGPGKAAASSRTALPSTARSVVSTSEAGTDDARNAASCKVAVPGFRDNGGTTGLLARFLSGGHGGLNSPRRDDAESCLNPSDCANRRAEGLPVRKKRIVLTACYNTCGFSPAGSGH